MQIILILFLLNFSQNYYLLSDMKISNFLTPGGGSKNFTTITKSCRKNVEHKINF